MVSFTQSRNHSIEQLLKEGYSQMADLNLSLQQKHFHLNVKLVIATKSTSALRITMNDEKRRRLFSWFITSARVWARGIRPVVIIQNDTGNKYSPTVIVAAITGRINKAKIPTHVEIEKVSIS